MEVRGKRVLVIGIARSGIAVAKFLKEKGAEVILSDIKSRKEIGDIIDDLEKSGFSLVLGQHPSISKEEVAFIVVSPGVPLQIEPIKKAREEGIQVFSEIEIAYQYAKAPIVAITGTNGKTTTTSLVGELFKNNGFKTLVGGNIGNPLIAEIEDYLEKDVIVAEVSSFQLETIEDFLPKVSVILNITPDHLDRHGTIENYTEAKANIFLNQQDREFTILNFDDPRVADLAKKTKASVIFFSRKHILEEGVYVNEGSIWSALKGKKQVICSVNEVKIPGSHNLENSLAAVAVGVAFGLSVEVIAKTLKTFPGVNHRLEFVAEVNGIRFINDSKGTNPDASIKALEAYVEPIVLIAGGRNKGSDFGEFATKIKEKVKELVLIGESAPEIKSAAEKVGFGNIHSVTSYPEAVKKAYELANKGEVVLLSPACASWDMFNNYEERGDLFKQVVRDLRG